MRTFKKYMKKWNQKVYCIKEFESQYEGSSEFVEDML